MKGSLAPLLPIHAMRERRAQRAFHEQSQAYESALSAQMGAALAVVRLQNDRAEMLAGVLDAGAMSAVEAQASIVHAASFEERIVGAERYRDQLADQVVHALEAVREARRLYAVAVRTSRKLDIASTRQHHTATRLQSKRAEQNADDDFAQRCGAGAAAFERRETL